MAFQFGSWRFLLLRCCATSPISNRGRSIALPLYILPLQRSMRRRRPTAEDLFRLCRPDNLMLVFRLDSPSRLLAVA
jgi:hypothetical protein